MMTRKKLRALNGCLLKSELQLLQESQREKVFCAPWWKLGEYKDWKGLLVTFQANWYGGGSGWN
jgi:hypothetical protein